ncbi:CsbD family protein [Noviherbaspirillum autotrophicum]|uniref:General stress protein CsbD n=1 Tax=Noviherbaspirillum autotrophicum TaxID=709839 RepID=A0A0C2BJ29_9BURK|nr:CsbD family protein [Noviherbaspirillum autotrophicum]KIF79979.1 general stress protein CsbD [Noviherbaspirillum autotrophicum]
MNRDQIKGGFKEAAGKIQRKFGKMVGSNRQESSGIQTEAEGKIQKAAGDVTDTVGKAVDSVKSIFKK